MKVALKPGTTPAQVLSALYNAYPARGMGVLSALHADFESMTPEIAEDIINGKRRYPEYDPRYPLRFDYLYGRLLKTDLTPVTQAQEPDWWGYDRDNGQGAGHRVLSAAGLFA